MKEKPSEVQSKKQTTYSDGLIKYKTRIPRQYRAFIMKADPVKYAGKTYRPLRSLLISETPT